MAASRRRSILFCAFSSEIHFVNTRAQVSPREALEIGNRSWNTTKTKTARSASVVFALAVSGNVVPSRLANNKKSRFLVVSQPRRHYITRHR